jgi:hypothetical protein
MNQARSGLVTICLLLFAASAESDGIWNSQLSPTPVAALQFNQNVNITSGPMAYFLNSFFTASSILPFFSFSSRSSSSFFFDSTSDNLSFTIA